MRKCSLQIAAKRLFPLVQCTYLSAWERVIGLEASPFVDLHVPIPKHQIPDDSK
jgi:hypothetical protein